MSDLFPLQTGDRLQALKKLLAEQAGKVKDIEEFSRLAKKFGVDTKDLDQLLKVSKAVFRETGVGLEGK